MARARGATAVEAAAAGANGKQAAPASASRSTPRRAFGASGLSESDLIGTQQAEQSGGAFDLVYASTSRSAHCDRDEDRCPAAGGRSGPTGRAPAQRACLQGCPLAAADRQGMKWNLQDDRPARTRRRRDPSLRGDRSLAPDASIT